MSEDAPPYGTDDFEREFLGIAVTLRQIADWREYMPIRQATDPAQPFHPA